MKFAFVGVPKKHHASFAVAGVPKNITPSLCVVCWQSSRARHQRHEHSELHPAVMPTADKLVRPAHNAKLNLPTGRQAATAA